jgi:hypothetical protein
MQVLHEVVNHLQSGRWHAAHDLVQKDQSELGAWLHGILHIQEGDLEDAEYWYGLAGRHFRSRGTLNEELADITVTLNITPNPPKLKKGFEFDSP